MIIYDGLKSEFIDDVVNDNIATKIDEKYYEITKSHVAPNEKRSWKNSMEYMYKVLSDDKIPNDSGVAIEFKIPNTSKRVDFILTGYDYDKNSNAIIIELKQWEKCDVVEGMDAVVSTYINRGIHQLTHPSYQAWSYCAMINDFNLNVQNENIKLHPCAYLHNFEAVDPPTLLSDHYKYYLDKSPAFIKGDVQKLRDFIKTFIVYGDNKETLLLIDNGKIKPSKALQDSLVNMLKGNQEFVMVDSQKVIYEKALNMAIKSNADGKKRVLIVKGGTGPGNQLLLYICLLIY